MSGIIKTLKTTNNDGTESNVYPRSVSEAIVDSSSNKTLDIILDGLNKSVGDYYMPVYFKDGVPVACNTGTSPYTYFVPFSNFTELTEGIYNAIVETGDWTDGYPQPTFFPIFTGTYDARGRGILTEGQLIIRENYLFQITLDFQYCPRLVYNEYIHTISTSTTSTGTGGQYVINGITANFCAIDVYYSCIIKNLNLEANPSIEYFTNWTSSGGGICNINYKLINVNNPSNYLGYISFEMYNCTIINNITSKHIPSSGTYTAYGTSSYCLLNYYSIYYKTIYLASENFYHIDNCYIETTFSITSASGNSSADPYGFAIEVASNSDIKLTNNTIRMRYNSDGSYLIAPYDYRSYNASSNPEYVQYSLLTCVNIKASTVDSDSKKYVAIVSDNILDGYFCYLSNCATLYYNGAVYTADDDTVTKFGRLIYIGNILSGTVSINNALTSTTTNTTSACSSDNLTGLTNKYRD